MNRYPLRNSSGFGADLLDWGGTVAAIYAPDRNGRLTDVALGWKDLKTYLGTPEYLGATVGRVANRIAGGRFELDGVTYQMKLNDGSRPNTLHGAFGYSGRLWEVRHYDGRSLTLALTSPDGDAGFPGELRVQVTYTVTEANELVLDYCYRSDRRTVANLTNHAYFNLNGEASNDFRGQKIRLNSDFYTETDRALIPTGKLLPLEGSPFDLRSFMSFEEIIANTGSGCDDNFCLRGKEGEFRVAAEVYSENTGISLTCLTTLPGVQLYMGGCLGNTPAGKSVESYRKNSGFCLETQFFPDAPHYPQFPSIAVEPDREYRSRTAYRFEVR